MGRFTQTALALFLFACCSARAEPLAFVPDELVIRVQADADVGQLDPTRRDVSSATMLRRGLWSWRRTSIATDIPIASAGFETVDWSAKWNTDP